MSKRKAMTVQGILVIAVGVVLLVAGGAGTIQTLLRRPVAPRVPTMLNRTTTSIHGPMQAARQWRRFVQQAKRFAASMGWLTLLGGSLIAAGGFIVKGKDWARHIGFGGVAFAILYFAGQQGTIAATNHGVLLPALLTTTAAGVASLLLWDLAQARLEG